MSKPPVIDAALAAEGERLAAAMGEAGTPGIALTDGVLERARIHDLEAALRSVIRAWEDPGPMGTMMQMPRAVSHAKWVLDIPAAASTPT